jgi:biotin transport system substrate-specific component
MKRRAVYPVALYLLLGAAGLPLFSRGLGGVGVFLLPNGGFLAGFIPAAVISGLAYEGKARSLRILGLAGATVAIYACGVTWVLVSAVKGATQLSLLAVLAIYVAPFLPGDLLKGAGVFLLGERLP